MKSIISFFLLCFCIMSVNAEVITLYNDNGQGGIHKSTGKTTVIEGQYYIDVSVPLYKGKTKTERHKVYKVNENARLMYQQPKWAEKYTYVIEASDRTPYYFNMKSAWKPSLTQDPDDPTRTIPVKKLTVMRNEFDGHGSPMTVLLVKSGGKYHLYDGDDCFGYAIEHNDNSEPSFPSWTRKYKYRSKVGGWYVFFNISQD